MLTCSDRADILPGVVDLPEIVCKGFGFCRRLNNVHPNISSPKYWNLPMLPYKVKEYLLFSSVQFISIIQSCPTLCNPMDCSMPGFPIHHQLPELAQTHVH